MPSQRCLRVLVGILRILERYNHTDAEIWRQILDLLNEVISLIEADYFGVQMEESSSEEEQEIDH